MAEFVAGQIYRLTGEHIASETTARSVSREFGETALQGDEEKPTIVAVENEGNFPNMLANFMRANSIIKMGKIFLDARGEVPDSQEEDER
jgi:hypothetical protein